MAKTLSFALSILLIFSFTGCKDKSSKNDEDIEPQSSQISFLSPEDEIIRSNKSIDQSAIDLVQLRAPKNGDMIISISTSLGDIYIILYPQFAPLAVDNFITHVENSFYNGSEFYKVVENFFIESGAPSGSKDKSIYLDENNNSIPFDTETHLNLWHFKGALAMRNKGQYHMDTNTSQFFIVQASTIEEDWFEKMEAAGFPSKVIDTYRKNGGIPGYDSRYTVFGQVFSGLDILDKIGATNVDSLYKPTEPVWIYSMTNSIYDENAPIDASSSSLASSQSGLNSSDDLSDDEIPA